MTPQEVGRVLLRPLLTEKSMALQEQGRYAFEVALAATKTQVKEAVEWAFKVKVARVHTLRVKGRRKRFGIRWVQTSPRKKAIVTLKPGHKITLFEGV